MCRICNIYKRVRYNSICTYTMSSGRGDNVLKYKHIYNHQRRGVAGASDGEKVENLTEKDLDSFLEKEKNNYSNEPWNKLNKTDKIKKLYSFAAKYVDDNSINDEKIAMEKFLKWSLETKRISKVKDLKYDKCSGKILEISGLDYDSETKKFAISRTGDNNDYTSKQLGTPKRATKSVAKRVTLKVTPKPEEK